MNQTPYKAIFFDLDGTILPIDMAYFMGKYMKALSSFVSSHGLDVEAFSKALNSGIKAMATHEDGQSNAAVFWDAYFSVATEDPATWTPLFESFYENEFGAIGDGVVANPCAAEAIKILQDKDYPLVLATMPMFPLKAVEWRLAWANVDPKAFQRITNFENSTSVKPKLAYYEENLRAGGLEPHEVLMVGNNMLDDFECLKLGMDGYLITDFLLNPYDADISSIKHGSFQDFIAWIKDFSPCGEPAVGFETGLVRC